MSEWREASRSTHKELFDRMRELEKAEAARNEQYDNIMEKLDRLIAWQEAEQAKPKSGGRPSWTSPCGRFWRR